MKDTVILELLQARSEQAIPALEQAFGPVCRSIARNILENDEDVEECVQDAWLAIWQAIPPERPDPLRPWVCRVVRNLSLKRYHRDIAQRRNSRYDAALEELAAVLPDSRTVEDELATKELTALLNRFLAQLDAESRRLFLRRYWYGVSVEQLSLELGLRPNTVSVRLNRIRSKLKTFLQKEDYFL